MQLLLTKQYGVPCKNVVFEDESEDAAEILMRILDVASQISKRVLGCLRTKCEQLTLSIPQPPYLSVLHFLPATASKICPSL